MKFLTIGIVFSSLVLSCEPKCVTVDKFYPKNIDYETIYNSSNTRIHIDIYTHNEHNEKVIRSFDLNQNDELSNKHNRDMGIWDFDYSIAQHDSIQLVVNNRIVTFLPPEDGNDEVQDVVKKYNLMDMRNYHYERAYSYGEIYSDVYVYRITDEYLSSVYR